MVYRFLHWNFQETLTFHQTKSKKIQAAALRSLTSQLRQVDLLRIDLQLLEAHRREVGLPDLEDEEVWEPQPVPLEPEPVEEPVEEEEPVEPVEEAEPEEELEMEEGQGVETPVVPAMVKVTG